MIKIEPFLIPDFLSKTFLQERRSSLLKDHPNQTGWFQVDLSPQIQSLAQDFGEKVDVLIVLGTGGSRASGLAFDKLLRSGKEKAIFWLGHDLDFDSNLFPKEKKIGVCLISQSGTTLEPLTSYAHLKNLGYGMETLVLSQPHSPLWKSAEENKWTSIALSSQIGGRFSALTYASFVPLWAAGFQLDSLPLAYLETLEKEWSQPDQTFLLDQARLSSEWIKRANLERICIWQKKLKGLGLWSQQLIGESEGKEHSGLDPIIHEFPRDLHSLEQIIQEGRNQGLIHHLFIEEEEKTQSIPSPFQRKTLPSLKSLKATIHASVWESHQDLQTPLLSWQFSEKTLPQDLGSFLAIWHLSITDTCLIKGINPFNQPGVENYKKKLRDKLKV